MPPRIAEDLPRNAAIPSSVRALLAMRLELLDVLSWAGSKKHEEVMPGEPYELRYAGGITMKTVIWTPDASWEDVLRPAGTEDVVVLRDGHPVILMTPFDDDDLAWYAREREPAFLESLAKSRRQVQTGETVTHESLKTELGLD